MTQKEKSGIELILENQESLKGDVKALSDNVDAIKRAVYGDETNDVKGLLQRQGDDERRHKELLGLIQANKERIEPMARVHSFIMSGKMWAVVTAMGTIIAALIHFKVIHL